MNDQASHECRALTLKCAVFLPLMLLACFGNPANAQDKVPDACLFHFHPAVPPPPPKLELKGGELATPEVLQSYNCYLLRACIQKKECPENLEELITSRTWRTLPKLPTPPPGQRIVYDPANCFIRLCPLGREINAIVTETRQDGGISVIKVATADGKVQASYRLDLSKHFEPATNQTDILKRWESWRLGGFVCFNDNQFVGSEHSRNTNASLFNPTKLNIAGWAKTMKQAGMNYAVLTTRHTSSFLLWDSDTTSFDVASSPCQTDVVGEFVKQCRKHAVAPGLYYCLWGGKDWMPHPNARAIILAQLSELATRYGEIPYFWIDMKLWGPDNLSAQEIYDAIKLQQPKAVVILNQHVQDGTKLHYFPTDVVNGEMMPPPASGHNAFREVKGRRYYLPFESEPVSQRIAKGDAAAMQSIGVWFTYGEGKGFPASQPLEVGPLFEWIQRAYVRGAANVLLSLAPDHTGDMRPADVRQLEELGRLTRAAEAKKK